MDEKAARIALDDIVAAEQEPGARAWSRAGAKVR